MRRLFTILSAFSLLLCGAAGVMGWRSWRHAPADEDRISWLTSGGDRMTIRSDAGRVTLFEPPAWNPDAVAQLPQSPWAHRGAFPTWYVQRQFAFVDRRFQVWDRLPNVPAPTLKETVGALRNDQAEWIVLTHKAGESWSSIIQAGSPGFLLSAHSTGELAEGLRPYPPDLPPAFPTADVGASLLPALEDPSRFAIAHLLLRHLFLEPDFLWAVMPHRVLDVDGLMVRLSRGKPLREDYAYFREGVPSIDPAQLPRIRDQWHRRLDVARASAPWWAIAATLAGMPLVWVAAFVRRALRRRQRQSRGLCRVCGYDLRASDGRCPECGSVTATGVESAG